jgi:hypothetical protein
MRWGNGRAQYKLLTEAIAKFERISQNFAVFPTFAIPL